jgi:hypothetical protein
VRCWRLVIGFAAVAQIAAGIVFFLLSALREAAPFGFALCAVVSAFSLAGLRRLSLVRAAIGANIVLVVLTLLGVLPIVIALTSGNGPSWLAGYAIGNLRLMLASGANAMGLRRLARATGGTSKTRRARMARQCGGDPS